MQSARLKSPPLPLEFYPNDIFTIKGVKFTPRQIDIIACLISGGTGKTITSLLDIDIKSLEAHKKSIGEKIGGGIQEDIIAFVQRSDKYELIKQHYLILLHKNQFEKQLKELSKKRSENSLILTPELQQLPSNKSSLFNFLLSHLKLAGIRIVNENLIIDNSKSYKLSSITDITANKFLESGAHKENTINILTEKIDDIVLKKISSNEFLDFRECGQYFTSFTEIIKKFFPSETLEQTVLMIGKEKNEFKSSFSNLTNIAKKQLEPKKLWKDVLETKDIRSDLVIPPDSVIINRDGLIEKIETSFNGQQPIQTIALVGIGGSGKTTLARQYAHSQKVSVIWEFNAETKESLLSGFESLALSLCNTQTEKNLIEGYQCLDSLLLRLDKITSLIKEMLLNKGGWLLIYDNVENFMDIQKYYPFDPKTWGKGKIIITTRNANIQHNKYINQTISVEELYPLEKLTLFTNITTQGHPELFSDSQKSLAEKFLQFIPSFPLDISIAAYYLNMTGITHEKYLSYIEQNQEKFLIAQENILNHNDSYKKTRYNIIVLSLKNLIDDNEDFRDLLLLICLLDSQYIPRTLLDIYKDELIVDNFIYCFKKHSILTLCSENNSFSISTFSIHRSTQEISLSYLLKVLNEKKKAQLLQSITLAFAKYINITLKQYINNPNLTETSWIQLLACHGETFLTQGNFLNDESKSHINAALGTLYFFSGNVDKSHIKLTKSLRYLTTYKDQHFKQLIKIQGYLGNIKTQLGHYEEAKKLLERNFIDAKKYFTEQDLEFVEAQIYLALLEKDMGNYENASILLNKSIEIYKKYYSDNHILLAWASGHLGNLKTLMGNYKEAKTLLEYSFSIHKTIMGDTHPRIVWLLICLASLNYEVGDYKEAIVLIEKSLNIYYEYQNIRSTYHIKISLCEAILGNIYKEIGEFEKSRNLLEKSYKVFEKCLPKSHIKMGRALRDLGNLHLFLGNYKYARNFFEKGLTLYKKDSYEVGSLCLGLGKLYILENKLDSAEEYLNKALNILKIKNHPDTYKCLEVLAELDLKKRLKDQVSESQNLKTQAINYLTQASKILGVHFPEDSPHNLRIQKKLNDLNSTLK